jgi:DNA-binding MarR family transcriptional regulator
MRSAQQPKAEQLQAQDWDCVSTSVRIVNRSLTRLYDEALAPSGLRITQLAVLAIVAHRGPFTMKALAKALVMDRTTLTADLRPLTARALVTVQDGADRRTRMVGITTQGHETIARAMPLWGEVQRRVIQAFGTERLASLLSDLKEVRALVEHA